MDPLEFRLRNYAEQDPHENKPFASKALRECYRQGADAFGWSRRSPEPRSMRDGNMLIGWGMATSTYPTHRMPASAHVRVGANGTALVQVGTQDLGTGTYTVMSQIAADELGMPVERIQFELGDSAFPHAPVSGGSMTVASVGPAVKAACEAVRAKLQGAMLTLRCPSCSRARNMEFVEATSEAKPARRRSATRCTRSAHNSWRCGSMPIWARSGSAALSAHSMPGAMMNAKTARSQLIGGIVYGLGMALLEETHVDGETGRIVNANIAEYLVPVNADVPDIQTIIVPTTS